MLHFCYLTQKGTSLRGTTSFDVFFVNIGSEDPAVGCWKNPKKKGRWPWSWKPFSFSTYGESGEIYPIDWVWHT